MFLLKKEKKTEAIKPRFFDSYYPKSMEDRSQYMILVILPLSTQVKLYLTTEMGSPCQKNGRKAVGRRLIPPTVLVLSRKQKIDC
jgi:hypothetical protein